MGIRISVGLQKNGKRKIIIKGTICRQLIGISIQFGCVVIRKLLVKAFIFFLSIPNLVTSFSRSPKLKSIKAIRNWKNLIFSISCSYLINVNRLADYCQELIKFAQSKISKVKTHRTICHTLVLCLSCKCVTTQIVKFVFRNSLSLAEIAFVNRLC